MKYSIEKLKERVRCLNEVLLKDAMGDEFLPNEKRLRYLDQRQVIERALWEAKKERIEAAQRNLNKVTCC